ncbi:FecCD family ABC transporter permease [Corynebacterium choanae]|uniref:Putative siderophore transport system permease protein YfhA n=1 Tax=Corynebacterium choanae TaxID=1862358 RepID=A0A3G6J899_9CORY|nr:iron ABC transporter permease [Corynebacterium choanae]AZA14032.1 putative siderophore transport system permease protein YfhA [Corynebacterium choanae]
MSIRILHNTATSTIRSTGSRNRNLALSRRGRWGVIVFAVGVILLVTAVITGDFPVTVADCVRIVFGDGSPVERKIVLDLRLGRALSAWCVGACLGAAGALTQSVARNPLASPDVLGITQGAALAAVAALTGLPALLTPAMGTATQVGVSAAALVGGLTTGVVVWVLAAPKRGQPTAVVLVGVGVSVMLQAATTWLIAATDLDQAAAAHRWLAGSLAATSLATVPLPLTCCIAVLFLSPWLAFHLPILQLGPTLAHPLGAPVSHLQRLMLGLAIMLTAAAVAVAGPVGFVAFAAPHIARKLGGDGLPPVLLSAQCGAVMVLGADVTSGVLVGGTLPAGILTTFAGAPILLITLAQLHRRSTS